MNLRRLFSIPLIRRLPLLFLVMVLFMPFSSLSSAQSVEVILEAPQLYPPYTSCEQSYWYAFANDRGHTAYLTLNTDNPLHSTNHGEWHPVFPQSGIYRVEAYIPAHDLITWCTGEGRTIDHDTTDAHYSIHHAYGETLRTLSQYPLSNQWLDLGEYYFQVGNAGYVSLTDLNNETEYSTTVSFSAMRFTLTSPVFQQIYLPLISSVDQSAQPPSDTGIIQAQGFDACHLPTTSEMQTWWSQSPYKFYALYLGGIQLPSICASADSSWVRTVHAQGWSFVPTWVGPQAPCSIWTHKMSADPAASYLEGRQEAQLASTAAAAKGLTNDRLGGTIIYYDMEVFGGASAACRQAASAFMNGWVQRLTELGNIAGGYGAHNSYVEDWANITHVPDDVWAASWYTDTYDPWASANTISWLDGLWVNHQRLRQYAGDHNERWGVVELNIDSDVADGMVAMPPKNPSSLPITSSSPSIEDAGWLSKVQGWLVSGHKLYWTEDQGSSWADISPAPLQLAFFMPSGQAWAISTVGEGQLKLYHSTSWGISWMDSDLSLPPDSWRPIQLQFTSATSGWIVLQKETSQAFSYAIQMKTFDGGLTWQAYNLPAAGKIYSTSPGEAWLQDNKSGALYHSVDGGVSWQVAQTAENPSALLSVPEGTAFTGRLPGGLGWAATSAGSCTGEKTSPSFTCQITNELWQTEDGGGIWVRVSLPNR